MFLLWAGKSSEGHASWPGLPASLSDAFCCDHLCRVKGLILSRSAWPDPRCYSGGARVNDRKEPISSSPNDDDDDPNAIPVPSFNAQTSLTHVTVFVALPTDDEEAEQLYLVDVHFGKDTPTRPIPLRHGATVSGAAGPRSQEGHRLVRVQTRQAEKTFNVMEGTSTIAARVAGGEAAKVWCLVHRSAGEDGTWRALYSFNEEEMFAEVHDPSFTHIGRRLMMVSVFVFLARTTASSVLLSHTSPVAISLSTSWSRGSFPSQKWRRAKTLRRRTRGKRSLAGGRSSIGNSESPSSGRRRPCLEATWS